MQAGQVRGLMGSTPETQCCTNVTGQITCTASSGLPLKPSDLEQQEGRILRQKPE